MKQKTTYEEKESFLRFKEIVLDFKRALLYVSKIQNVQLDITWNKIDFPPLVFLENSKELLQLEKETPSIVHYFQATIYAFKMMRRNEAFVLWNTYFVFNDTSWWMNYFSRATFFRLKKKAIQNFLYLIDNN